MVELTFGNVDTIWEFLLQFSMLFLGILAFSYLILRIARVNEKVHLVVHALVTVIFGTGLLALFFFGTLIIFGYVINYGIKSMPSPLICYLGMTAGLAMGVLAVTRMYLIDEGNRRYHGWIYLISIICGLPIAILEFSRGFQLFSFWMSSVPLMYLGTKIGVWYLRKRRISRWKEKGLEG